MMHIVILVIMYSMIGMAWNLLGGYCGQVSFGHAAFFGVGAYTAGILYSKLGLSAWWGILVSVPVVGAFSLADRVHLPAVEGALLCPCDPGHG